jgi:hydrogenase maturation protein HypF
MKLEKYLAIGKPIYDFDIEIKNNIVRTIDIFRQLDEKIKNPLTEKDKADYSFSMVKTIIDSLTDIAIKSAQDNNIKSIGLSGGVTYNVPITEMVEEKVKKKDLDLLVHNRLPNGDGCISIGQNVIVGNKL